VRWLQNVARNFHRQSYPRELLEHVVFDQGAKPSERLQVHAAGRLRLVFSRTTLYVPRIRSEQG